MHVDTLMELVACMSIPPVLHTVLKELTDREPYAVIRAVVILAIGWLWLSVWYGGLMLLLRLVEG